MEQLAAVNKRTNPIVVRIGLFLFAYLAISAYVMNGITDLELQEVAPYFLIAILIQFIPFVVRKEPEPFEPACLSSIMTLLALVPGLTTYVVNNTVQIRLLPQVTGRARIELIQTVMLAYMIGTVSYLAGYYQSVGVKLRRVFPEIAGGTWKRSRFWHVCFVGLALFVPAYAYFQSKVGVSLTDFTKLAAGKAVWREAKDGTGSLILRGTALGFIPVVLIIASNFPKPKLGRLLLSLGLLGLMSALVMRIGQRGTTVYVLLNVLVLLHYLWRKIPLSVLAGLGFVMLVTMNLLGEYRTTGDSDFTASQQGPTANFDASTTLAEHEDERERIATMAVVFHFFPDRKDYLLGESWGPLLTTFIPRWLWPEKAWSFKWRETSIVRELVGAPMPVNYLGLLYANFSWGGVLVGMFTWGMFQRGLYEWLQKNSKDRNTVLLYSFFVIYVGPTLLQISGSGLGLCLPLYVALRYMRKLPRKQRPMSAARPTRVGLLPEPQPSAPPAGSPAPTAAE